SASRRVKTVSVDVRLRRLIVEASTIRCRPTKSPRCTSSMNQPLSRGLALTNHVYHVDRWTHIGISGKVPGPSSVADSTGRCRQRVDCSPDEEHGFEAAPGFDQSAADGRAVTAQAAYVEHCRSVRPQELVPRANQGDAHEADALVGQIG